MAEADSTTISFSAAKAGGHKYYWTGRPCKRGHIGLRYSCDQSCVECKTEDSLRRKERAARDPDLAERMRKWQRDSKAKARNTEDGRLAHRAANRRYVAKNREKVRAYYRERRASDPDFRMSSWCRSVLHKVLSRQNLRKDARCAELLGYTGPELRKHIERQFTPGMSWEQMGISIHIDHIIPVADFIKRGETRPSVIHALSNLRPMWAKDNMRKSDRVESLL